MTPFPIMAAALALAEFAPIIARWLDDDKTGAKSHEIASEIVNLAMNITNTKEPIGALRCLQETPTAVIAFQKAVMEMETSLELSFLHSRQEARWKDMAFLQVGRQNLRADIMVISAATGLVTCLGVLGYYGDSLPGEAVGIISTIAGIFGACLKDAFAFEFGSSRGSREKDAALLDHR